MCTTSGASGGRTAREQRIIAGFEEIERFVAEHDRTPSHGENNDIFERLYAVRLDRIRESVECREVLKGLDPHGLFGTGADVVPEDADDEELLASLGVDTSSGTYVTKLVHVRSRQEIQVAEEVAQRNPCPDFEAFKPIFEKVQRELESGVRQTETYRHDAEVIKGDFFILDGQKLMVADWEPKFTSDYGRPDRRLRVVYDNGTESDLLIRSLQRALYKDPASRRINEPGDRNLFSEDEAEDDLATGYIYVLRSKSDHPSVAENRSLIHKIGLTQLGRSQCVAKTLTEIDEVAAIDGAIVIEVERRNIGDELIAEYVEVAAVDSAADFTGEVAVKATEVEVAGETVETADAQLPVTVLERTGFDAGIVGTGEYAVVVERENERRTRSLGHGDVICGGGAGADEVSDDAGGPGGDAGAGECDGSEGR
ncbi:hypothetical protein BH11PLA2_BH11PLA2_23560 [soil metagenome]